MLQWGGSSATRRRSEMSNHFSSRSARRQHVKGHRATALPLRITEIDLTTETYTNAATLARRHSEV